MNAQIVHLPITSIFIHNVVIPAKAGIHLRFLLQGKMHSRFRGNDGMRR